MVHLGKERRGIGIIVVLALVAITLAVSYAMLRTQTMQEQILSNRDRKERARQAALAGLSIGIRAMSDSSWGGVGSSLAGDLDEDCSYGIEYQIGDPHLSVGDSEYTEFPYRVTVTATGACVDPSGLGSTIRHQALAVVRLVPRKLADPPASWAGLQGYSLYQWGTGPFDTVRFEIPARLEGPVRFNNRLRFVEDYPQDGEERPFAGVIDELLVCGSALTSQQIEDLADGTLTIEELIAEPDTDAVAWWRFDEASGTAIASDSIGAHDGYYDGASPGSTSFPLLGSLGAVQFDGFNDAVRVPPFDLSGDELTILTLFKADHFDEPDGRLLSKATGVDEDEHNWMFGTTSEDGAIRLRFRLKTSDGVRTLVADSGNLQTGTWIFAAAVYDGSRMRLYRDGQEVGDRSHQGSIASAAGVPVMVGNSPPGSPVARYLRDLKIEHRAGGDDHRPLTGPIEAALDQTSDEIWSYLEDDLQVTLNDTAVSGSVPLSHPGSVSSYRLFPGGPTYSVPTMPASLSDTVLVPDPSINPLGVYHRNSQVVLGDNVTFQGILIVSASFDSDLELSGNNISLGPVTLPKLVGDSGVQQLPVVVAYDDIRVLGGSSESTGMLVAFDEFAYPQADDGTNFNGSGAMLVEELYLAGRNEWDQDSDWWQSRLAEFLAANPATYASFPEWLESEWGLTRAPKLRLGRDPANPTYHWPDWSQPLFVPHPEDGGLRWEIVHWTEVE